MTAQPSWGAVAMWLAVPTGIAMVLLALLDMSLAVLHVEREGPLSGLVSRGVWRVLISASRPLRERGRGAVLSWGIPLMIGAGIGLWVLLLIGGFGLLYVPAIHQPDAFAIKDRPESATLQDALYFSGVSFLTTGYGDIVPERPLIRLLATLEGAAGLLTISLSVTYLVAVFPIITRKLTLAISLGQDLGGRADGLAMARRYAGREGAFGERLARIHDELLYLGLAHSYYPLLFYVRPRAVHESFVRVLALVQGIVALRYLLDPKRHADLVGDPRLALLEEGLMYTLHNLDDSVHLHVPQDEDSVESSSLDAGEAARRFRQLLHDAAAYDLASVSESDAAALAGYTRFLRATDPYIQAYAARAAYDLGAVWAPVSRRGRDTAITPPGETEQAA